MIRAKTMLGPAAMLLIVLSLAGQARAQEQDILAPDHSLRTFILSFNGTTNNKTVFSRVRAMMRISHNAPDRDNPLEVVIEGYPELGARDSIYWNSNDTRMDFIGGSLQCRLTINWSQTPTIHFFYMSPVLFKNPNIPTQHEAERIRWVELHAKPTKIFAQEGLLTLNVSGNMVTGRIEMTGYDTLGREPVKYVANFSGTEYIYAAPKR